MKNSYDVVNLPAAIIFSICIGSALLLAFVCYLSLGKTNVSANRWLGVFLTCLALALLNDLADILGDAMKYPILTVLSETTRFALGPSLYLSIICFTTPGRGFKRRDLLHFLPFFLFLINSSPFLFANSPYLLNRFDSQEAGQYIRWGMFLIVKVQVIVYWILSFFTLKKHQKNIKLLFSSLESVDLKWMIYFLLSLLFAVFIWFNQGIFGIQWINDYSSVGYLFIIYSLSYFVIKQREVFYFPTFGTKQIAEVVTEQTVSKDELLSFSEIELLKVKLKQLMTKDKCFLNPDLELPSLAARMNLTPHKLSYLINKGLDCNFFEFVNSYRIEEAKNLLLSAEHEHLNILGIAYEAGFNSKTTFNTTFKKATGLTPSQFKKGK